MDETSASGAMLVRFTVVGLFDDNIDAEQSLIALQRADRPSEQVSLVIRDRGAEEERASERTGAVARALVTSALDAVGGWLKGLASLIVPERGTYLVAGPLGAALATLGATERADDGRLSGATGGAGDTAVVATSEIGSAGLLRTLREFGFASEEATYLEHRLAAGAALVAITTGDADHAQSARRLFGAYNAVFIGIAHTEAAIVRQATEALASLASPSSSGDIVVADAVAPLRHLCGTGSTAGVASACGLGAVATDGQPAGIVEDILADPEATAAGAAAIARYVVLTTAGWLGLGRRSVVIPAEFADLTCDPVQVHLARSVLADAPVFTSASAFSRRDELAVLAYFGVEPYWADAGGRHVD